MRRAPSASGSWRCAARRQSQTHSSPTSSSVPSSRRRDGLRREGRWLAEGLGCALALDADLDAVRLRSVGLAHRGEVDLGGREGVAGREGARDGERVLRGEDAGRRRRNAGGHWRRGARAHDARGLGKLLDQVRTRESHVRLISKVHASARSLDRHARHARSSEDRSGVDARTVTHPPVRPNRIVGGWIAGPPRAGVSPEPAGQRAPRR